MDTLIKAFVAIILALGSYAMYQRTAPEPEQQQPSFQGEQEVLLVPVQPQQQPAVRDDGFDRALAMKRERQALEEERRALEAERRAVRAPSVAPVPAKRDERDSRLAEWRGELSKWQARYTTEKRKHEKWVRETESWKVRCESSRGWGEANLKARQHGHYQEGQPLMGSVIMSGGEPNPYINEDCESAPFQIKIAKQNQFDALRQLQDDAYAAARSRGIDGSHARLR